ncbi:MAG TPA: amidohydrolase family protein [Chloroflexota bacterium]
MSYQGHPVIDTDSHIYQFWDLDRSYKPYIDPAYREKFQRFSATARAWTRFPGDSPFPDFVWQAPPSHPMGVYDAFDAPQTDPPDRERGGTPVGAKHRQILRGGREIDPACNWDPTVRLKDMDKAGIDFSAIFPSSSDSFCAISDVGFEAALSGAYNRFMTEYCSGAQGRLLWVAGSVMRDIPESVAQLRHWAEHDENFGGTFISRVCPDGTMLDNPNLHPLFAASQELDLPIWVHGGAQRPPFTPWVDAPNSLYHSVGGMFAMTALIAGGVFDLFPRLRIGLFESFSGWMPYLVEKLDEGYRPGSPQAPYLKRKPSEIVASGQLFCAIEADEGQLEHVVADLGEHPWLFTTDYPHPGTSWPDGLPQITERKGLAESAKINLLEQNAKRFLPRLCR